MSQILSLTAVGLAYDGIGVIILGYAFFSKSIRSMMIESGTYLGGNNAMLESLVQARTDGVIGTILLFFGFMLQGAGTLDVNISHLSMPLVIVLLLVITIYVFWGRGRLIRKQILKGKELRQDYLEE